MKVPDGGSSARFASNPLYLASYSCGLGLSDMPPSTATYVMSSLTCFTVPTL
jgi:hypothetical protein